jgi:hypothetical protein
VEVYRTIKHLQGFGGAAEFLRQDVRFALQRRERARVNGQSTVEIGQGGPGIFAGPADTPGNPALVIGWVPLGGLSTIRGGSGGISRLLPGPRSNEVDAGIGSSEF